MHTVHAVITVPGFMKFLFTIIVDAGCKLVNVDEQEYSSIDAGINNDQGAVSHGMFFFHSHWVV